MGEVKKGLGRPVHLRPLGIGGSSRRIAARSVALQAKGNNAAGMGMSQESQCCVGCKAVSTSATQSLTGL